MPWPYRRRPKGDTLNSILLKVYSFKSNKTNKPKSYHCVLFGENWSWVGRKRRNQNFVDFGELGVFKITKIPLAIYGPSLLS